MPRSYKSEKPFTQNDHVWPPEDESELVDTYGDFHSKIGSMGDNDIMGMILGDDPKPPKEEKVKGRPKKKEEPKPKKELKDIHGFDEDPKKSKKTKTGIKEDAERRKVVFHLNKMDEKWPGIMSKHRWNSKMTTKELQDIEKDAMTIISSHNADSITKTLCLGSANLAESLAPMISWDLSGFSEHMKKDPAMGSLMDEMALKYDSYEAMPVELRFAFAFGSTAVQLNSKNQVEKFKLRQEHIMESKNRSYEAFNEGQVQVRPAELDAKGVINKLRMENDSDVDQMMESLLIKSDSEEPPRPKSGPKVTPVASSRTHPGLDELLSKYSDL